MSKKERRKQLEPERIGDFLTVAQAAEHLGVSPSTLRNWDREGKLKAARHPLNRYRLYSMNDLNKLTRSIK